MNLSAQFKEYLISQSNPPSLITVKNYISDINKFIRWIEAKLGYEFNPSDVNQSLINKFKEESLSTYSASSVERSLSSLRKFFYFLKLEGKISQTPFDVSTVKSETPDPWRLKEFKNHLYVFGASHLTIKNYIIDVKQFLTWADEVVKTDEAWEITKASNFSKITSGLIEVYKTRLLNEAHLSPVSVNRKLSSIRRFISWANEEGLIKDQAEVINLQPNDFGFKDHSSSIIAAAAVTEALDGIGKAQAYSAFAPLRVAQKTKEGAIAAFDTALTAPLADALEKSDELVWNLKGRPVFKDRLKASFKIPSFKMIDPKKINNVPKSFYAPALISTANFPLHKKALHHVRHSRPKWYKTYHSYAFVSYLHFSILMLFISAMGYMVFNDFNTEKQTPIFAALPSAPPRILSFQGRLTDANDNPITKGTTLRMAIYNNQSATGSALLWQEIVSPTPDEEGIFSILLGNNTPIPQSLFAQNSGLWLGVTVERTAELKPRQQIATVAFAANAETLQGLPPITNTTATSNVVLALNSSGNLTIGGTANPIFQATGGTFTVSGRTLVLTTSSNGNIRLAPNGSGIIDIQKSIQNTTNSSALVPGSVTIEDIFSVVATSSGQAVLNISQGSTGDLILASTSGNTRFKVDNAGNITANGSFNGLAINSGTVTSGTWQGTAIGAPYGGTGQTSYTTGDMLYASDSTVISKLSIGSNGTCLTSNGTAPSWVSCLTASGGSGYFNQSGGAVFPNNSTVDLLIGGQSTASAKFAITNIAGSRGSQTATLSGNIVLDTSSASIETTNGQTLSLGGSNTGFINIDSGSSLISLLDNTSITGTLGISGLATFNGGLTVPSGQTTTFANFTSDGGIFYGNGSGVLQQVTAGTNTQCLLGGTTPTFGSCATGVNQSKWREVAGVLSPNNSTLDVTIGGLATSSSKFAFLNVNSGTPTASMSSSFSYSATLNGQGSINFNALNGNDFRFKVSPGGDAGLSTIFYLGSEGNVGIGTTTPKAKLDIIGSSSQSGTLTLRNNSTNDINFLNGSQFRIRASAGGDAGLSTALVVLGNGNVGIGDSSPQGLFTVGSGDAFQINNAGAITGSTGLTLTSGGITLNSSQGTSSQCLLGGTTASWGSCALGTNNWQLNTNLLSPINSTWDFAIGGTASTAAKFAILNVAGTRGSQTATLSGSLTLDSSTATIQTTNNQTLSLNPNGGRIGIGTSTPATNLEVRNTVTDPIIRIQNDGGATLEPRLQFFRNAADYGEIEYGPGGGNSEGLVLRVGRTGGDGYIHFENEASIKRFTMDGIGLFGFGTTSPVSQMHVTRPVNGNFPATGKALAIFDQIENQDILTASKSGVPMFTVTSTGNLQFKGGTSFLTTLTSANDADLTLTLPNSSASTDTLCLQTLGNCAAVGSTNYWQLNTNLLSPINSTYDFAVGGTASTAAKFAILNVAGTSGTQTATLSGSLTLDSSTATIQTTNNQSLSLNPNGGRVGIGTTTPQATLDVVGNTQSTGGNQLLGRFFRDPSNGGGSGYIQIYADNSTDSTTILESNACGTSPFNYGNYCDTNLVNTDTSDGTNGAYGNINFYTNGNPGMSLGGGTQTGRLRIGGAYPTFPNSSGNWILSTLDVRPNTQSGGNIAVASISGQTSFSSLVVDNSFASGDIFTASKSGKTHFVISRNGHVGIGKAIPTSALDIVGLASNTVPLLNLSNGTVNLSAYIGSGGSDIQLGTSSNIPIYLQTNNKNTLTLYGSSQVGIGTNTGNALGTLDVRNTLNNTNGGTISIASISGSTSFAALTVDNSFASGDIFTASKSGKSIFTIDRNGNVAASLGTNFITTLTSANDANLTLTLPNSNASTDTLCLQTLANCASASTGSSNWTLNTSTGILRPNNSTLDVLFGGISTSAAKFAFINNAGGTPVASISANSGNGATFLSGGGQLGTANRLALFLGNSTANSTTGDVFINSNAADTTFRVGIGTTDTTSTNSVVIGGASGDLLRLRPTNAAINESAFVTLNSRGRFGYDGSLGSGAVILSDANAVKPIIFLTSGGGTSIERMRIGPALTNPSASISGATSFAGLVVDNSFASGDIFTASKSGKTHFVIDRNGNVGIGNASPPTSRIDIGGTGSTSIDEKITVRSRGKTALELLSDIDDTSGEPGGSYVFFSQDAGNHRSFIGQSNVGVQDPLGNVLTGGHSNGLLLATLDADELQLGTDNIIRMTMEATGQIGIGIDTGYSSQFHLTRPLTWGATGKALAIFDQIENQDIFTASASGTTKLVIDRDGNIGIGTNTPEYPLHISQNQNSPTRIHVSNTTSGISSYSLISFDTDSGGGATFGVGSSGTIAEVTANRAMVESGANTAGISLIAYDPSADIRFFTAGEAASDEKMRLSTAGKLGIGNTSPNGLLDINGRATGKALVILNETGNQDIITASASGTTVFRLSSSADMFLQGATSPSITFTDTDGEDFQMGALSNDIFVLEKGDGTDFFRANTSTDAVLLRLTDELSNAAMCYGSGEIGTNGISQVGDCTGTGADYAERYPVEEGIQHGELVALGEEDVMTYGAAANGSTDWNKELGTTKRLVRTSAPYQVNLMGITSDNYSDFTSTGNNIKEEDNPMSVALNGRVLLRVSTENGPINAGDMITSSSIPGVGMKATKPGRVVGMAVSSYSNDGIGDVMVFVNIHHYDPDVQLADSGMLTLAPTIDDNFEVKRQNGETVNRIGAFSEILVARIKSGYLETGKLIVTGSASVKNLTTETLASTIGNFSQLSTDSIVIGSENITIAGQSLRNYIASIVEDVVGEQEENTIIVAPILATDIITPKTGKTLAVKLNSDDSSSTFEIQNLSGTTVAAIDALGNASLSGELKSDSIVTNDASISGTLRATKIIADQIEGLNIQASSVSANYITNNYYSASSSAQTYQATGSASFDNLVAMRATFEQGLMAFGPASFYEASVADRLFVGSRLSLADTSINVLGGNLELQPLSQGGVSLVGGQVEIDVDGNLRVDGNAYFAKDVDIKGKLLASFVSPLPGRDFVLELGRRDGDGESENHNSSFVIRNSSSSALLSVNNQGDLNASGAGTFNKLNLNIVNKALALSPTEVIATGSAGTAEIQPNREELTVRNALVTEDSLIYITTKTSTQSESVYLLRQVPGKSFTVGISNPINKKVPFNWIIIN